MVGTSVGLALRRAGVHIVLTDHDRERVRLATAVGAGDADDGGRADLCVIAVPPEQTGGVIARRLDLGLDTIVTDTCSIKAYPLREAESFGRELSGYVGGHPIAGRERAGPAAGRADLFKGRNWVVTPHPNSTRTAIAGVTELAERCGAAPVVMTPPEHDRVLAALSHLPQLVASALAAEIGELPDEALTLAGQGLIDMTRIADSPDELWAAISAANATPIAHELGRLADRLRAVATVLGDGRSLEQERRSAVRRLVQAGSSARRRLPGKHGGLQSDFASLAVAVPDAPGELARLFADIGRAEVNIEDFTVEHEPGRPVGIVILAVHPDAVLRLRDVLTEARWSLYR